MEVYCYEDPIYLSDISDEVFSNLEIIMTCFTAQFLSILGIVGSLLNMIILSRHGMRDTTNMILFALSVSDLVYSLTQIVFQLPNVFKYFDYTTQRILTVYYFVYFDSLNSISVYSSINLVTLLSIERVIAVCFPFHVSRLVTKSRMKLTIVCVVLFNVILRSPILCTYYVDYIVINNNTMIVGRPLQYYYDNYHYLFDIYNLVVVMCFIIAIPIIVILTCTVMINSKLSVSPKAMFISALTNVATKRKQEVKSVKTVLIINFSVIFFVLIPWSIFTMLGTLNIIYELTYKQSRVFYWTVNILFQINSSFNFVIYVTTSAKFKKTFIKLFCCTSQKKIKRYY